MGSSGDETNQELKRLVADTREKSENKFNDVLSKLKGKVNGSPVFSHIYHCRISFIKTCYFFPVHPNSVTHA